MEKTRHAVVIGKYPNKTVRGGVRGDSPTRLLYLVSFYQTTPPGFNTVYCTCLEAISDFVKYSRSFLQIFEEFF